MNKKPIEHQRDWTRANIFLSYNNQNTKCTEQRKNIKSCKGKRPSSIWSQTYQNYARNLNRDLKSQKGLDRGHENPKRTQMPAQDTTPSKTLNQHRWRNQNILGQNQIQTISIYQSSPILDSRRKAPTQGRYLHQRKNKIQVVSQQS